MTLSESLLKLQLMLPIRGQGRKKSEQIAKACLTIYDSWKISGWAFADLDNLDIDGNECLANVANWLYFNTTEEVKTILNDVSYLCSHIQYLELINCLVVECAKLVSQDEDCLAKSRIGDIYECEGKFIGSGGGWIDL